jgi:hypothetical protein
VIEEFRRIQKQLAALPEPLAYIVLDHSMRRADKVEERDGHGRKYLRMPPSVMDALLHRRAEPDLGAIASPSLTGIPVHRREDMPEGWPYTAPCAPQHAPGDSRKGPS